MFLMTGAASRLGSGNAVEDLILVVDLAGMARLATGIRNGSKKRDRCAFLSGMTGVAVLFDEGMRTRDVSRIIEAPAPERSLTNQPQPGDQRRREGKLQF